MKARRRSGATLAGMGRPPQIIAFGGGGFSMENGNPLLDDHVLSLTGRERPRVCFIPTASGDADHYVVRFYRAFSAIAETSHVSFPPRSASRSAGSWIRATSTCSAIIAS